MKAVNYDVSKKPTELTGHHQQWLREERGEGGMHPGRHCSGDGILTNAKNIRDLEKKVNLPNCI